MFILKIAFSIGLKNKKLVKIVMHEYNGARYIILVSLKLICVLILSFVV